jgi:hypothetical protein
MKITVEDFEKYVSGWLMVGEEHDLSYDNMLGALHSAIACLPCDQDGVEALTERRRLQESERKKQMVEK